MSTDPTVIVAGARTPMGRMSGSLKGFSGSDLGGFAIGTAEFVTMGLLPGMVARHRGHIVNISSISVLVNAPRFSVTASE